MSDTLAPGGPLPVGSIGARASGWWGVWFLIISDASIFAYLAFSYFYFSVQPGAGWTPGGPPSFLYAAPQTAVVLIGCVSAAFAERSIARGALPPALVALGIAIVLAAGFIALQFLDWRSKPFGFASSTYSSEYFVITGLHLAHVVAGWVMFIVLFIWSAIGYFGPRRHVPITVGKLYWYFLAAVWLVVFFVINITPCLFG